MKPHHAQAASPADRQPPMATLPPDLHGVQDYEALAQPRMAPDAWAHINGVAGEGRTQQANRDAYARWCVLPRVLQPMAGASTAIRLLGQQLLHPFVLAPVAYQRLAHSQGELATAEAAMALGGGMVLSTQASHTLEDVARVARRGLNWPEPEPGSSSALKRRPAQGWAVDQPGLQTMGDAADVRSAQTAADMAASTTQAAFTSALSGAAGTNTPGAAEANTAAKSPTGPGMPWFQLYFQPERAHTLDLLRRAEAAGYAALVLTVDAPIKLRHGFVLPPGVDAANLRDYPPAQHAAAALADSPLFGHPLLATAPTWDDVAWLRSQTRLPIWVKGVLTAHDAQAALAHGADGLMVSNHGGRVLDGLPPTLHMLPGVVRAVREWAQARQRVPAPVLVDGGIRSGTDAFKAICLGASAVLIGRPYVHGLAAAGGLGVAHVIHLLRAELELSMLTAGCAQLSQAGPHMLMRLDAA
jgi:4-hydroxymandelate oxidase